MTKFTKEHLQQIAEDGFLKHGEAKEMARQLLASMEQEPVAWRWFHLKQWHVTNDEARARNLAWDGVNVTPLYAAPQLPQPALVPDEKRDDDGNTTSEFDHGWNACRAAMIESVHTIQAAPTLDILPKNDESVTTIKPVADLFEVTVPSGRSTTFTTDAAEAKDCADMGWKVQEYVTLERYQVVMLQNAEPDFREISNSSTKHFRENAKTSTRCPKCSGRGSYHCPMMLGNVECECTLPAALQQEVKNEPLND